MDVDLISKRTVFDSFLQLEEAQLRYKRFDGTMSNEVVRLSLERGDSVAAVVLDVETEEVILTNQFRYSTYAKDGGWILELPAGRVEQHQDSAAVMKRELLEELGLDVRSLQHLLTFYTTPGGSSERIWLYYAEIQAADQVGSGGGLIAEGEDIKPIRLPRQELHHAIGGGHIQDAKTLVGLLWLLYGRELDRGDDQHCHRTATHLPTVARDHRP
jgi:nudix-type nucleoside diphosphatase (YffH/AdpP family)